MLRGPLTSLARARALVHGRTRAAHSQEGVPASQRARTIARLRSRVVRASRARVAFAVAGLSIVGLVSLGIPGTMATLNDQVTMAQVSATAGTVNPPTGLTPANSGANVNVPFTAPAAGIAPQNYTLYRSTTSGSGYAALTTNAASPLVDTTNADCTTYFYTARSNYANLQSVNATEASITTPDRTKPVIGTSHIYGVNGAVYTKDFVKPAGNYEVYANVTDNCATAAQTTVTFTLGGGVGVKTATAGSYTPVAGGPTYNYKAGPFVVPAGITNGTSFTNTINASDLAPNAATPVAGTSATGDTVAPTLTTAAIVPNWSNWYWSGTQYLNSTAGNATDKTFFIYAIGADAGAGTTAPLTMSASTTNIATVASATLNAGTYTTADGKSDWTNASTVLTPKAGLTSGTSYGYTITITDGLGNASGALAANATADTVVPTTTGSTVVSSFTNWKGAAGVTGQGSVSSSGNAANKNYYVYALGTDALSGATASHNTLTVDASLLTTGATALPMTNGAYTTDDGAAFTFRTAATAPDGALSAGAKNYTVKVLDPVGNFATSTRAATVINTPTVSSCASVNNAGNTLSLRNADALALTFGQAMDPRSFSAGWTGAAPLTNIGVTFHDSAVTNDWMDAGALGLFAGSTGPANALDTGFSTWYATGTSAFPTSTFTQTGTFTVFTLAFGGGANTAHTNPGNGTGHLASTIYDQAGNTLSGAALAPTCSTAF